MPSVDVTVRGPIAKIEASEDIYQYVQGSLNDLMGQLSSGEGDGEGLIWWRRAGVLWVLTGLWAVLAKREGWVEWDGEELVGRGNAGVLRGAGLWDHQADAVEAAIRGALWGRGIIKVPTGGGKTRIAVGIVMCAGKAWDIDRWIYVVQNGQLAKQTAAAFGELGAEFGYRVGWSASVECVSYGGLAALGEVKGGVGVIVDECHGVAARTRALALLGLGYEVQAVIGLSGTPLDRMDSKNAVVVGLCGPVLYEVGMMELEEKGKLARGKVTAIKL